MSCVLGDGVQPTSVIPSGCSETSVMLTVSMHRYVQSCYKLVQAGDGRHAVTQKLVANGQMHSMAIYYMAIYI